MGYENAPSTKFLATHCAACGRPLRDAKSVQVALGPDCRERHGYDIDVPEAARSEANVIINRIALDRTADSVPADLNRLLTLGFTRLASIIGERLVTVKVEEKNGLVRVHTPYSEQVVAAMRAVPGRRWNKLEKVNEFPTTSKRALNDLLGRHFNGQVAMGPKGLFVIGAAPAQPQAAVEAPAVKDEEMVDAMAMYEAELARIQAEDAAQNQTARAEFLESKGAADFEDLVRVETNRACGKCPDGCCGNEDGEVNEVEMEAKVRADLEAELASFRKANVGHVKPFISGNFMPRRPSPYAQRFGYRAA